MESDNGTKASAMIYSIIETAKANELNTYKYLDLLLTEIPQHMNDKNLAFIDDLLPWLTRAQKEFPIKFKKSYFFKVQLKTKNLSQALLKCRFF